MPRWFCNPYQLNPPNQTDQIKSLHHQIKIKSNHHQIKIKTSHRKWCQSWSPDAVFAHNNCCDMKETWKVWELDKKLERSSKLNKQSWRVENNGFIQNQNENSLENELNTLTRRTIPFITHLITNNQRLFPFARGVAPLSVDSFCFWSQDVVTDSG